MNNKLCIRKIHYTIPSSKLLVGENIKKTIIADLHGYTNNIELAKKLADTIKKGNPQSVYIAGDIFEGIQWEDLDTLKKFKYFLENLSELCPVFLSLGNHDRRGNNSSNSYVRENNFRKLESVRFGKIFPLVNEVVRDGKFVVVGYTPNQSLSDGLANQEYGVARDEFIREYDLYGPKLEYSDDNIIEFLGHNPYLIGHTCKDFELGELSKVDLFYTGHLHNGFVKIDDIIRNPKKYMDIGYTEKPFSYDADGKFLFRSINPFFWGKIRLTRGTLFINNYSKKIIIGLNRNLFFRNDSHNHNIFKWRQVSRFDAYKEIIENKLHALVISGGINKYNGIPFINDNPEITNITLVGNKKKILKLNK